MFAILPCCPFTFTNQQILFIKRFSHYIKFHLFKLLVLIENRTPPVFCLTVNNSLSVRHPDKTLSHDNNC